MFYQTASALAGQMRVWFLSVMVNSCENCSIYILAGRRVFIGFLNNYSDYETQGYSKDELIENLKSLLVDLESSEIN